MNLPLAAHVEVQEEGALRMIRRQEGRLAVQEEEALRMIRRQEAREVEAQGDRWEGQEVLG